MTTPKFKPGQSGNPAGRPKGKPSKVVELRAAIEARADEVLQSVINAAIMGDMTACKMLLDRITPTLKPQAPVITLDSFKPDDSLLQQCVALLAAIVSGQLNPDTGKTLMDMVKTKAEMGEIAELSAQVAELKEQFSNAVLR